MLEREMEDLIATYPADFFPGKEFKLIDRQKSFAGVGRFDVLFEDRFKTKILMELKAGPAKYEVADQLARYRDELYNRGENRVLMWVVAPHVPLSTRQYLDHIGIEYSEIHFVQFRQVAERHGYLISSDKHEAPESTEKQHPVLRSDFNRRKIEANSHAQTGPQVTAPSILCWRAHNYDLMLMNCERFDASQFVTLINSFENAVPNRRNATLVADLRRWANNHRTMPWPHQSNASLLRWVITSSYKSAAPHANAIWTYLFGNPAPKWYVWNHGGKNYEFDSNGWKVWFNSLNRG